MIGDLHPHGQNSPDIPMSSIQNFFTLRFHFRRDIGMAGSETRFQLISTDNQTQLRLEIKHEISLNTADEINLEDPYSREKTRNAKQFTASN